MGHPEARQCKEGAASEALAALWPVPALQPRPLVLKMASLTKLCEKTLNPHDT